MMQMRNKPPKSMNPALDYRELAVSLFHRDLLALGFRCNGFGYVRQQGSVIVLVTIKRSRFGYPRACKGAQTYGVSAVAYVLPGSIKLMRTEDLRYYRWFHDNSMSYSASIPGTHVFAETRDGLVVGEQWAIVEARAAISLASEVLAGITEPLGRHTLQLQRILQDAMPAYAHVQRRKARLLVS